MQLEDYFNFLAPDDIRLKGSRIGIESVLYQYIHREQTPSEIQQRFPTLSLEQVHATILYYLHNKEEVDAYMTDYLEWSWRTQEEERLNPPPVVLRLREIRRRQLEEQQLAQQNSAEA